MAVNNIISRNHRASGKKAVLRLMWMRFHSKLSRTNELMFNYRLYGNQTNK